MNPYEAPQTEDSQAAAISGTRQPLASSGKRLGNLVIDRIAAYGVGYGVGILLARFLPLETQLLIVENGIWDYVLSGVISLLYFFLMELYTGRTLGKLITGTKVLNSKHERASAAQLLGRSLMRFIPLEPLSILASSGLWHDSASRTIVVDMRAKPRPSPRVYLPGERPLIVRYPQAKPVGKPEAKPNPSPPPPPPASPLS
jgi:uncharacterized RDD family membrane protein YckC